MLRRLIIVNGFMLLFFQIFSYYKGKFQTIHGIRFFEAQPITTSPDYSYINPCFLSANSPLGLKPLNPFVHPSNPSALGKPYTSHGYLNGGCDFPIGNGPSFLLPVFLNPAIRAPASFPLQTISLFYPPTTPSSPGSVPAVSSPLLAAKSGPF